MMITLLTDFGWVDPFLGVLKAAIYSRYPEATLIDLTHEITPGDVDTAGFWWERCRHWFPPATIHVGVVDPGVGSCRQMAVARADGQLFVGPFQGLFDRLLAHAERCEVYAIEPERLSWPVKSHTFHGRDIFAPVAAELAAGRLIPEKLGAAIAPPQTTKKAIGAREGRVVVIDRFGNLITDLMPPFYPAPSLVEIGGLEVGIRRCYADVRSHELVALVNSFGTLEVAERDGNAAFRLGLGRGASVHLK